MSFFRNLRISTTAPGRHSVIWIKVVLNLSSYPPIRFLVSNLHHLGGPDVIFRVNIIVEDTDCSMNRMKTDIFTFISQCSTQQENKGPAFEAFLAMSLQTKMSHWKTGIAGTDFQDDAYALKNCFSPGKLIYRIAVWLTYLKKNKENVFFWYLYNQNKKQYQI